MKKTPITTIMREELNRVALWRPGISVTFQDTSYSRTKQTKRWASKYLDFELKFAEKDRKKLKNASSVASKKKVTKLITCLFTVEKSWFTKLRRSKSLCLVDSARVWLYTFNTLNN